MTKPKKAVKVKAVKPMKVWVPVDLNGEMWLEWYANTQAEIRHTVNTYSLPLRICRVLITPAPKVRRK